jgi:hypothetical protein
MDANARTAAHQKFHQDAAESAWREVNTAMSIAAETTGVEHSRAHAEQLAFEHLARLHDLAASGVMAFADCPTCHETEPR